ncbi:aldehyde dehydrogenase family protein [Albidovulum sediminicola]|uniref:Aldehyde dehydrogenase family protein n=1 Tax=Albidovulum sediminicola TaxID=2984331 RepID=A0ABT2Z5G0_9RHOB|nr:aldehyde dehydrogenase family protein [Defluviimonas sp. WL0075]MCV2866370.1 aldehyde dehydrogenase family protein [Defluviimonas sp. WL0075]
MKEYTHFIRGAFTGETGEKIHSVDPATGRAWSRISRGSVADADRAMRAADHAFREGPWAEADGIARADFLERLADHLELHWQELVEAEVRDNGKRISEVRGQFSNLHMWYRHFAAQARKIGPEPQANRVLGVESETQFLPYGVVVAITPWNSPLMILAWKLGPALAAGNTVVVKPSELASASTLEFARLAHEAGLPAGVLNVVTGYGHEAGEALVRHPLTRKVTFTGSDTGGRKVAAAAAEGVVPTTLELGGKSPQIVFADADLSNAMNGILSGIFLSNGQSCVAGSRLIVEASIAEIFVERLLERARILRLGDPMDPTTQVGPLANEPHWRKVTDMIEQAKADGATCLLDGTKAAAGHSGFYVGPTIFTDVAPKTRLWQEEVFGPVLAVTSFTEECQAVALANDSDYGLAGGVWTADPGKGKRVASAINAGTVYINHYRSTDPGSPIGGVKLSGYGRELGPDAVKDYLQVKSVWTGHQPMPDPFPSP